MTLDDYGKAALLGLCIAIDDYARRIEYLDESGGDSTDALYSLLATAKTLASRVRSLNLVKAPQSPK